MSDFNQDRGFHQFYTYLPKTQLKNGDLDIGIQTFLKNFAIFWVLGHLCPKS